MGEPAVAAEPVVRSNLSLRGAFFSGRDDAVEIDAEFSRRLKIYVNEPTPENLRACEEIINNCPYRVDNERDLLQKLRYLMD